MFLIVFIGGLYLFFGCIYLLTALLIIELGRPKDLIQAGLLTLLGIFLIIYKNMFNFNISCVLALNALIISFYFIDNFSNRWNQLLEKEKLAIKSFSGLKKNFSLIYKIISLDIKNIFSNSQLKNIFKNTSFKKKWVRRQDNNDLSNKEASSKEYMRNIQTADFSKKDIMNDEKIKLENIKIDKQ